MNKISSYEELVTERRRLEGEIVTQKAYIKNHINSIKDRLEPFNKVINFVGGLKSKPGSTLLKLGSNVGIDLLARQKLKKAGWLARLILPLALKLTAGRTIDKMKEKTKQPPAL